MPAQSQTGVELGRLLPAGIRCDGFEQILVKGLQLDSRKVAEGDLFLAVKGWKADGREFISQAVANGCVVVVAEADSFEEICPAGGTVAKRLEKAGVPLILIADLQAHVSLIAANYYDHPGKSMDVLGVTGTNGKTTCVSLIARLAHLLGNSAAQIGTLGWGVVDQAGSRFTDVGMTTPDAISLQEMLSGLRREGVDVLAMEVSSHGLEQGRVSAAAIDCAIFTNLSRDHLDFHGSEESYGAAKARLFDLPSVKQAIVNIDDEFGEKIFSSLPGNLERVSYGLCREADVRATDIIPASDGATFRIYSPWGEGVVKSKLLGDFNVLNLLAVIAVFCLRGVELKKVISLVPLMEPVPGRMQIVSREKSPRVVVDYSHTPDALKKALISMRQHCRGQLWCVFGCGGDRDRGKRSQMGVIAEQLADQVIVTSDNPRNEQSESIIDEILVGMTQLTNVRVIVDRLKAIETAIEDAGAEDCILVAGKGHEQYQQIGDRKLPFSDVQVASLALDKRAGIKPGAGA